MKQALDNQRYYSSPSHRLFNADKANHYRQKLKYLNSQRDAISRQLLKNTIPGKGTNVEEETVKINLLDNPDASSFYNKMTGTSKNKKKKQ